MPSGLRPHSFVARSNVAVPVQFIGTPPRPVNIKSDEHFFIHSSNTGLTASVIVYVLYFALFLLLYLIGVAPANGLFHETVGVMGSEALGPGNSRPGRIPGQTPGEKPGIAKGGLIAPEGRYALCCQRHAGQGQQEHERQIEPAESFAYGLIVAKTVLRWHDGLRRGRHAARGRGARPAEEGGYFPTIPRHS